MTHSIPIRDSQDLGEIMRTARRLQRLRQDQVGRFSHSFIGEVEMGKPTAQIGKVLEALRELGLKVHIELPAGIDPNAFERLPATKK